MSNRLGGKQGTAYTGTNANQPPNWVFADREPNQYDFSNVSVGDFWLNSSEPDDNKKTWLLVSLAGDVNSKGQLAHWIQLNVGGVLRELSGDSGINPVFPDVNDNINIFGTNGLTVSGDGVSTLTVTTTGGGPVGQTITGNSGGPVQPDGVGNWNVVGDGVGITITGNPGTHTLTATLVGGGTAAQSFPTDSGTASPNGSGALNIIANHAANNAGSSVLFSGASNTVTFNITDSANNTFVGKSSGNLSLTTATKNTCIGALSGSAVTTGSNNVLMGYISGELLTTGSNNTCVGYRTANTLLTGSNNTLIGANAGFSYTGAENGNLLLDNQGTLGESTTTRIGTSQTAAYMAGVYGATVGATNAPVIIDNTGKLGTSSNFAFLASATPTTNITGDGTYAKIVFDSVVFNVGSAYNSGTGTFTAPLKGIYSFSMNVVVDTIAVGDTYGQLVFYKNGVADYSSSVYSYAAVNSSSNYIVTSGYTLYSLNVSDTIEVYVRVSGGAKTVGQGNAGAVSSFKGNFLFGT